MLKTAIKGVAIVAACVLSLTLVLPATGTFFYVVTAIVCGSSVLVGVAIKLYEFFTTLADMGMQRFGGNGTVAEISIVSGLLAGFFWPAALLVFVFMSVARRYDVPSGSCEVGPDDV